MPKRKTRPTGKRLNGSHYLAERTHCVRGHELTGDNVITRHDQSHPNGRMCRACARERSRLASRIRYWSYKYDQHANRIPHGVCADCLSLIRRRDDTARKLDEWRASGRR